MQGNPQSKLSISGLMAAALLGLVAAFGTGAAASWVGAANSPWIIAGPAIAVGLLAFFVALWRMHAGESVREIWQSVKELWDELGRSAL